MRRLVKREKIYLPAVVAELVEQYTLDLKIMGLNLVVTNPSDRRQRNTQRQKEEKTLTELYW
jgi:hypothetical protein